ncbi:LamG domain-containing protein [Flavobacterium sp. N502536]|uniref:LamG domain-containing protein n=1 Tax=Flavobacterium sp. N502536 TaxID=2986837 RepID=UPI002221F764|nr:LamG domain-containing protein [Flavobacterium sp. N502536]
MDWEWDIIYWCRSIKTPLTRVLNWNTATPFSVNVIFVQKNNSGYQEIISNRVTGIMVIFFSISCRLDGTIWVNLQEAGIIGDNLIVPYNLNEVTSITLTYSGALIKAYKNGVLFGQVASTRIIGSNNCFLGRIGNVSGQGFKGIIYDAKIFSKELTKQEVSHLFVTKGADVSATALSDLY